MFTVCETRIVHDGREQVLNRMMTFPCAGTATCLCLYVFCVCVCLCVCFCFCICVFVFVCVCKCVREREGERERVCVGWEKASVWERKRWRGRGRKGERVL